MGFALRTQLVSLRVFVFFPVLELRTENEDISDGHTVLPSEMCGAQGLTQPSGCHRPGQEMHGDCLVSELQLMT